MKNFSFLNNIKTTLKPGANQVITTLTILLLLLCGFTNNAWGECILISNGSGSVNTNSSGQTVYSCSFSNDENDAYEISYTCRIGTYTNVGKIRNYGQNVNVDIYYKGGWHNIATLAYGYDNYDKSKSHTLSGDEMQLTQVRFVTSGGTTFKYDYIISDFKIVRKALGLNLSSYEFPTTPNGGSLSQSFTISTVNNDISVSDINITGTNSGYFSKALSSPSSDCPKTYTLTITYSPEAITEGDSKHTATITISKGGMSASLNVSGTASNVASPLYTWKEGVSTTRLVDDTLDLQTIWTSTSPATCVYTIETISTATGTNNNDSVQPHLISSRYLALGKASTVKIKVAQDATTGFTDGFDEVSLTVNKRPNTFTNKFGVWNKTLELGADETPNFSSSNPNAGSRVITQEFGNEIAKYNEETGKLTTNYHIGDAQWTFSQAEDYKYFAAAETLNVHVDLIADVECLVTKEDSGNEHAIGGLTNPSSYDFEWDVDRSGAADSLIFTARRSWGDTSAKLGLFERRGSTWQSKEFSIISSSIDDNFKTYRYAIDSTTTAIRFDRNAGTNGIYIKNIYIERKRYTTIKESNGAKIATMAMPDKELSGPATTKTFYLDYSTCDDKIRLESSSSHITFGNTGSTAYEIEDNVGQNIPITLTYSHNALEDITAKIYVYTIYRKDSINVTARTIKNSQTITWEPASLSAYTVDTVTLHASAVEQVIFSESSDVAALSIIDGDTLLTFTGASASVAVNANAAANDDYYAAEQVTKTWNVSLTPTTVTTAPTIAAYTYGEEYAINASAAVAKDEIKNKVVAGSYTVKEGEDVTSIGTRDIKLVFTPENTNMYESCECTVSITVNAVEKEFDPEDADPWADVDETSAVTIPEAKDVTIEEEVVVYSLTIEEGTTVTITPTGGLTIGDGGVSIKSEGKLVLKANTGSAKAEGYKGQTSYIVFSPDYKGEMPEATVEMYSVGYRDLSGASSFNSWQYVGVPVDEDSYAAKDVFPSSGVRSWNEAEDKWVNNRKTLNLEPFVGYATQQYTSAEGMMLTFDGQLAANRGSKTINLTKAGEGWNLIANSFAAPIDITKFDISDFGGATATIYIWDTESRDYIEVPVGTAKASPSDVDALVVPSMQGFFVQTSAATTLTLDYDKLVWGGEQDNCPLRSKRRAPKQSNLSGKMRISLIGEDSQDDLTLLESEQYAKAYENGYDAPKKHGEGCSVYAIEDGMEMGFDATSNMDGTVLGIRSGSSDTYTLKFTNVQTDSELYLKDIYSAGSSVRISEGTEYTFYVSPNSTIDGRFEIVSSNAPAVATDIENGVTEQQLEKYIKNGQMFILKDGVKYNSIGQKIQ